MWRQLGWDGILSRILTRTYHLIWLAYKFIRESGSNYEWQHRGWLQVGLEIPTRFGGGAATSLAIILTYWRRKQSDFCWGVVLLVVISFFNVGHTNEITCKFPFDYCKRHQGSLFAKIACSRDPRNCRMTSSRRCSGNDQNLTKARDFFIPTLAFAMVQLLNGG